VHIHEQVEKQVTILTVSGRIDSKTAREFETHLKAVLIKNPPCLLLDMGGVEYITSAGMRALASTYKAIRNLGQGAIAIANLRDDLAHLFQLIGFDGLFTLYESVETALVDMISESC
jgi:anti-sigma B factor antagonist